MGRTEKPRVSSTKWQENKLIITTQFDYQNPKNGERHQSKLTQTIWLEEPTGAPWEPKLIVETWREGVLGGVSTTNRTVYSKGYR